MTSAQWMEGFGSTNYIAERGLSGAASANSAGTGSSASVLFQCAAHGFVADLGYVLTPFPRTGNASEDNREKMHAGPVLEPQPRVPERYKARNAVERGLGWLKRRRCVATPR